VTKPAQLKKNSNTVPLDSPLLLLFAVCGKPTTMPWFKEQIKAIGLSAKAGLKRRTSHEPNANEGEQRVFLICIRLRK